MCTVSWVETPDGLELFCNRDELRTRAPGAAPRVLMQRGVRYLAPMDGDRGGTWIAANEFGIAIALLNRPRVSGAHAAPISRGAIVTALADSPSLQQAQVQLDTLDLKCFEPFTLAILQTGQSATVVEWDGERRSVAPARAPILSSSSFDPGPVVAGRMAEFATHRDGDPRALHASHTRGPSAYSICMHRPDAQTVSFSRVRISAYEIEFAYSPAAPCRGVPPVISHLRRRPA